MYFVLFLYISLQSETTIKLNNMKNFNYNELQESNNFIALNDKYNTKVIMARKPFFTHDNGVNVFKVIVICTMRGKRVLSESYTLTDYQTPFMIINNKTVVNPHYKLN